MKCLDERILSSDSSSDTLHNTNTKPTSVERDSLGSPPKHGPATRSPSGLTVQGVHHNPFCWTPNPIRLNFFAWKFRTYGYPTTPIVPRPFFSGKFGVTFLGICRPTFGDVVFLVDLLDATHSRTAAMISPSLCHHTVDGSEIPFPTTWNVFFHPVNNGDFNYQPQLVFSPDFWLPSTVSSNHQRGMFESSPP